MNAAVATRPALSRRARSLLASGMIAASLMIGTASAIPVGAQPVGPGLDSFTVACRGLQDRGAELVEEYGRVGRANPNDPRLDEIIAELRNIGMTWQQIGCKAVFGTIALQVAPPPGGRWGVAAVGADAGVLAEPTAPSKTPVKAPGGGTRLAAIG